MERTVAQSGVTGRSVTFGDIVFAVAGREDNAELRGLLRDNATDGWIRLALTREPDLFAAASILGPHHGIIIARHRLTHEPVGMCEWSARPSYIDGEPRLLAYIGALRVAPRFRHRVAVLKGGFEAVRRLLHEGRATPYALTSIAAENRAALRILGANLKGLPVYRPVELFSTFALRPRRSSMRTSVEPANASDMPAIAVCLNRSYRHYQFAPVWSARDLLDPTRCAGLRPQDFLVIRRGPGIAACIALWDQNSFKQTIVHGYAGPIGRLRSLINLAASLAGMPSLPAPGVPLRQVYLSHLAADNADDFHALLDTGLLEARRRGFALALIGLAECHPLAEVIRRSFRPREYRALLHLVHWGRGVEETLSPRLPHVEIAVL